MVLRRLFGLGKENTLPQEKFDTCRYAVMARSPKCTSPESLREMAKLGYQVGTTTADLPTGKEYCSSCRFYEKKTN